MEANGINGNPVCPKTWMVESILVTILCCLPLGIVGIVNAAKVNSLYSAGKYDEALRASNEAGKWTKIGAGIGLVGILLYIILVVIVGVGSSL